MATCLGANKKPVIYGDGTQTRDFTFVSDVVETFILAAKSDLKNEILNVGSGEPRSVNELVELLGGEKTYIPKRPGEPDCTCADISKIKENVRRSREFAPRRDYDFLVDQFGDSFKAYFSLFYNAIDDFFDRWNIIDSANGLTNKNGSFLDIALIDLFVAFHFI